MPTLTGLRCRLWAAWGRKPARLYYANGGIGDELMLTAIAAAARAAGRPIHVLATYPEIWRDNRDAASVEKDLPCWLYAERRRWIATQVVHLAYVNGTQRHIAEQMAAHASVSLPENWRPALPAMVAGPRDPGLIVVQNSCRGARYRATTKEWPQDRWAELLRRLAGEFRFVQLGTASDPPLVPAEDRRGQTTLRAAANLLAQAHLFVGLESGLMHVAAAVRTPSVIIYGGRSRPSETGYPFNRNVTRTPACAGCGLNGGCPHQLMCMEIPVAEVEEQVRSSLETAA